MTRCDAYWLKVRQFLDNGDRAALEEFCEKNPRTIRDIVAHAEYMDRHFEKPTGGAMEPSVQKPKLSERATRPLRELERIDPVLHAEVLGEVLRLEEPTAPAVAKLVAQHIERPEFVPRLYDIWSFNQRDPRYGQADYKWGLICGQIIENLLYYYTEPGDLVLDPMAGGGTALDVCAAMGRRCMAFDIEPARDDIIRNDITKGLPDDAKDAQLAVLEPPYYNMMQEAYPSPQDYYDFLRAAIKNTADRLADGGHLALITMDQVNIQGLKVPIIGPSYRMLETAGLYYEHLIGLPLQTQQFEAYDVARAKDLQFMLGINRQMWVFRRGEG